MQNNYLRKGILSAAMACLSAGSLMAQAPGTHTLELTGGFREYLGDMGSSLMFAKSPDYQGGGVSFGYYVNPAIDLVGAFSFGDVGFTRKWEDWDLRTEYQYQSFRANTMDLTVAARFKFNNGSILAEDAKFAPYIQGGLGGFYAFSQVRWGYAPYTQDEVYWDVTKKPAFVDMNAQATGSAGFNLFLTDKVALHYSYSLTYTFSDMWDGAVDAYPDPVHPITHKLFRTNDAWGYHGIGVTFSIGESTMMGGNSKGPKDKDMDGVPDKYDLCKNTEERYRNYVDSNGCNADTDGDGIFDADDKCPEVAGKAEFNGCPDRDGDGIQDSKDACPDVPGKAEFGGCPDTDGDGIADNRDECPTVPGTAMFNGCPDSDGDGIEDRKDKCPDVAGNIAGEGCPDTDGDGVYNNIDKCPDVPGIVANKGCPEIKPEVIKKIALAAKGINFETGKAVILESSFSNLDQLVTLLNEYPEASVEVQGHTDNVGSPESNKTLSQERTESVVRYLVLKGVAESRLTAVGYGQEMPIADNSTARGKALNRRVDFKLSY